MRVVLAVPAIVAALALGQLVPGAPAGAAPNPPPSPVAKDTPAPQPPMKFVQKVVFAIVLGNDQATQAKVAVALASELHQAPQSAHKAARAPENAFTLSAPVVPEGGWTLNDYIAQCKAYPDSTQGAFIVLPPSSGVETANYLVLIRQKQTIAFNALIADCYNDPAQGGTARILWASDTATGDYGRAVVQFLPFAVLTSVYLAFAPQRTFQTVTTRSYPVSTPLPPGGERTSVQTENQTVLNPQGTGQLQTNVVGAVGGAQLAYGRQPNPDHLTMHAAEDAVGKFLLAIQAACPNRLQGGSPNPPAPNAAPSPTDFCRW